MYTESFEAASNDALDVDPNILPTVIISIISTFIFDCAIASIDDMVITAGVLHV